MLRLLIGTDWVAIRDEILRRIAEDVSTEKENRILLVPELVSHDTERRLCAAAGDTASRFAEVLTFTRLARRVSEQTGMPDSECMDAGGRIVAMAAAAKQLSGQLKVYASVLTKPEFLKEMVDAVDEFKRCCIRAEDLRAAAGRTEGSLAQKLEELALLLSAYDAICAQGKRDPRDRELQLLQQLCDSDFSGEHVFYVDAFPDYTRQHMAILEHLIANSPCVSVGINCDELGSKAMAFEKAGQTAFQLYRAAKALGVEVTVERIGTRQDRIGEVCLSLFQGSGPQEVEQLHTAVFDSVYDEVSACAAKVLELVQEGCRYRDICIVAGDMGVYQNAARTVFERCGIPLYQSGVEDILGKTVINTVLSAMDAALGGFEQRAVIRYLKSALSPLDADRCDGVENYALLWNIQGKAWERNWDNHPDGLNQIWTEQACARLEQINADRALALEPLCILRTDFMAARNLAEQVQALYGFLERIGLAVRLKALAEDMDRRGDNRGAQILSQLWEILLGAMEQLHDVLGKTVWDAESFTRLFTMLLGQYDVGTIPPVLDAVSFGPVSAMRCHSRKYLFVLGVSEGMLPGYGGSRGLLTDQERIALRKLGVGLTGGAMEGVQAEFAEIYGVFRGAEREIWVSSGAQTSYVYRRLAAMADNAQEYGADSGAILCHREDAAAYLARMGAFDEAKMLSLEEEYRVVSEKVGYAMGCISRENVERLYGSSLKLSASQIDRQAECRMSYFLKYGMRAKERKQATLDPAEFGTYVHDVLENTARTVMERGGFHQVSLEQTIQIAMEHSDRYAGEHFAQLDSSRAAYLFRRNRQELELVVEELWRELKNARFTPKDFELQFGDGGAMAQIDISGSSMSAALRGFVDRVDIWNDDGRNYFRVVDYKTGKKDFDYCDVLSGVGLQMLLYLFALEQDGYGKGAGVQYFPARVPMLNAEGRLSREEAALLRSKQWVRRGLLLSDTDVLDAMDPEQWQSLCCSRKKDGSLTGDLADREQLRMLRSYIFTMLGKMVDDIASGNVQANPYTRGTSHDACSFCPYGSICHKEQVDGRRNYKAVDADAFWERIGKEVNGNG